MPRVISCVASPGLLNGGDRGMRHWLLSAIFALLLPEIAAGQPAAPRVVSEGNGIVLERDGSKKELTRSPQDVEPVLSPDGRLVYYTRRAAGPRDEQFCGPKADELRVVSEQSARGGSSTASRWLAGTKCPILGTAHQPVARTSLHTCPRDGIKRSAQPDGTWESKIGRSKPTQLA